MKKIVTVFIILFLQVSFTAQSVTSDNPLLSKTVKNQLENSVTLKNSLTHFHQNRGVTAFVTVGTDLDCDFHTGSSLIQDAMNSGAIELRLMAITFNETLFINDRSVILIGGYESCADAQAGNPPGFNRTQINGIAGSGFPVIRINGNSQRNFVTLKNLRLMNGSGSGLYTGGGVSTFTADLALEILNTELHQNTGAGGGLAVFAGNTDVVIEDSSINNNSGNFGGGIYCVGTDASITISGESGIINNHATGTADPNGGKGGGMFVSDGCNVIVYSGTKDPDNNFWYGINNNKANTSGGGIYAESGAIVTLFGHEFCQTNQGVQTCIGNDTDPVNLSNNRSDFDNISTTGNDEDGVGAYFTDENTAFFIYAGLIQNNSSSSTRVAGGLSLTNFSSLTVKRLQKNCWSDIKCNYFIGNKSNVGGALLNFGSSINVSNTVFENNRANLGTVLFENFTGSTVFKGCIFYHNGDNGLNGFNDAGLFYIADSSVDIEQSAIVDNHINAGLIIDADLGAISKLRASIIQDDISTLVFSNTTGSVTNDCNITHNLSNFAAGTHNIVADPQFIDRANNDYHISATSPAIDYCDNTDVIITDNYDMDFEERGWDDPSITNNFLKFFL